MVPLYSSIKYCCPALIGQKILPDYRITQNAFDSWMYIVMPTNFIYFLVYMWGLLLLKIILLKKLNKDLLLLCFYISLLLYFGFC